MAGNQYMEDPRQTLFLSYYLDPTSGTFSNALQSALKAGYSQEYSESITSQMPDWLSDKLGDLQMLSIAETNLLELLQQGEDIKVKADITKFVAKTLGKEKYSERQEIVGRDGKDLIPEESKRRSEVAIDSYLNGKDKGNTSDE